MAKKTEKITLGILVIILIGLSAVLITALSSSTTEQKEVSNHKIQINEIDDDQEIEDGMDEEISPQELRTIDGLITESQAEEIALQEVESGIVTDISTERENDRILYEVKLKAGNDAAEIEVDAETGEVLEVEWNDDDDD